MGTWGLWNLARDLWNIGQGFWGIGTFKREKKRALGRDDVTLQHLLLSQILIVPQWRQTKRQNY